MRRRLLVSALSAVALVALTACGTSSGGGIPDDSSAGSTTPISSATSAATPSTTPTPSATTAAADCTNHAVKLPAAKKKFGSVPHIAKPTGKPPCKLIVKDLKVGTGQAVNDTSATYDWNYEGVQWSDGKKFDSSFDRHAVAPFALNQVIPGWTTGLQGMKVGGRRMLVIPPAQAYGASGQGAIGPNETLVFVVDLVGPATSATPAN